MNIVEHEERLEAAGFKPQQVRELIRFVTSGDERTMTKADGKKLEDKLDFSVKRLEDKIDSEIKQLRTEMGAIRSEMGAQTHRLTATAWTVGGVVVAAIVALTKLTEML